METIAQSIEKLLTPNVSLPEKTFDWQPALDAYEPTLKQAAAEASRLIAKIAAGRPGRWLTISGPVGCGKTMLARQIFSEARRHNHLGNAVSYIRNRQDEDDRRPECVWLEAAAFGRRMRAGEYDLPEYLARDFIVVLDDLGAERDPSGFLAEGLFRFCNARLGKWTVFTTNLDYRSMVERVDERVASRIVRDENVAVKITAGDYALRKKGAA